MESRWRKGAGEGQIPQRFQQQGFDVCILLGFISCSLIPELRETGRGRGDADQEGFGGGPGEGSCLEA